MKRKSIALLLGGILLISSLAGCGNSGTPATEKGTASTSQETKENESSAPEAAATDENVQAGDIVKIVWQYPAMTEVGEAFYRMEDALNEKMEKDIGVHVSFEPCDLLNSQKEATLMISAGEQLDICLTAFTGINSVIDSGLIMPIDEYIDAYGQDIVAHSDIETCKYDNQIYGVTTGSTNYRLFAYSMKKSFAEKYDCMPDDNKIYTLDEMEAIFDKIKAGEGDEFLCYVPWNNTYEPLNYNLTEYDQVGDDLSCGVLMLNRSFEDTTIYDLFETPEYSDFCERMYRWAQKGFISADAAVTTDAPDDIITKSNVLGTFHYGAPTNEMRDAVKAWGGETVQFKTVDAYVPGGTADIMWNVTSSSKNPGKAVEALNYIYKNKEAAWLVQFGFEGEEYEILETEGENYLTKYMADDASTLPYFNVYGIWGDRLEWPVFEPTPITKNQVLREFQDSIPESRYSPAIGYSFKTESVSSEIAAIGTVIAQYAPSLNAGAVDPAKALPEFIDALKSTGIEKVIAENQKQFDEWLALQ